MKNKSLSTILLSVGLLLAACSSTGSKDSSSTTSSGVEAKSITPIMELALGTMRLEGTNQAVDQETAAQLLPYWQLMQELSANPATASEETAAVVENIRAVMTAEQIRAIGNMKLTQSDVAAVSDSAAAGKEVSNSNMSASMILAASAGGGPGGAPPEASGMIMGGGGPAMGSSSGQNTSTIQNAGIAQSTSLINRVIQLLESRMKN
jgi:hypothetical protein